MKRLALMVFIAMWTSFAMAASTEELKLNTARGAQVDVIAQFPDAAVGGNRVPAVILAPGQGYHMKKTILQQMADKAVANGMIALRFNWNYFSTDPQNGQPSPDLGNEVGDLEAVIQFAKTDPRIDPNHVILAGKSLGTLVAYDVFRRNSSLSGLILMTPVCTEHTDDDGQPLPSPRPAGEKNYPNLQEEKRPIVFAVGNADPLCSVPMLYSFLGTTQGNVAAVVVGGNHSWNIVADSSEESARRTAENIDTATASLTQWEKLILNR